MAGEPADAPEDSSENGRRFTIRGERMLGKRDARGHMVRVSMMERHK